MPAHLTTDDLLREARLFAEAESQHAEPALFGVTDGKAVGTYLEQKFKAWLAAQYVFEQGNSASGIDLPGLGVDIKTTSARQPQSSSPFKAASQKIYGLGYSLLVFVYDKTDDVTARAGRLHIGSVIYVEAWRTADYQTTSGIRRILENGGNADDIVAFMSERNLPIDYDIEAPRLAEEIMQRPPEQGYLTISNALQWRLQYGHALGHAGAVQGLLRLI